MYTPVHVFSFLAAQLNANDGVGIGACDHTSNTEDQGLHWNYTRYYMYMCLKLSLCVCTVYTVDVEIFITMTFSLLPTMMKI